VVAKTRRGGVVSSPLPLLHLPLAAHNLHQANQRDISRAEQPMDLATGALGTLLPKLRQLLEDEYKLDKGAKKSIEFLSGELESMRIALRNVGEVPREQLHEMVKMFAREAREMSYDTEDIIDTFLMRVQEPEPPSEMKRLMKKMVGRLSDAKIRREFCEDIMNIKEHVNDLAEQCARYKVDHITTVGSVTSIDPRLVALYCKETDIVGIEGAKKELYMMLLHGDDVSMRKQRIASIVGYAGLGKTTLAKAVYDELRYEFHCTAFVSVSRNSLNTLLKVMLYQLSSKMFHEKQLIDGVRKFLRNKRYLIVLDDIWDKEHWKIIQCALPGNDMGSKIITTTRKLGVAEVAGGCYKLKPLSDESSRRLFHGRIFGPGDEYPQELLEVSEKILKKCGGVPLALVTTSGLLANKMRNKYEWHKVCDSVGSGLLERNIAMDNMRRILSLSYYDLPSHLKTCLLYLSIFPEDSEIRKDQLIWRWIAEDFVQHQERDRSLLFEIGESYFNELVNRSLVQPTQMNDDGTPCACRVHVMVLDLICSLSREESFVVFGEQDSGSKIRRLALHNRNGYHSLGDNMGLRQLRSLNAIGCPTYVIPPVSSFFHLRVLDLESCGSMEGYDLKYLGKLLCLKFMGLRNTFVRKLPEEIGHLKFLQTLELEGSGVEELPARMGELTGLMRLNADWMTRVPDWIGKLTSMQQLVMYPGSGDE